MDITNLLIDGVRCRELFLSYEVQAVLESGTEKMLVKLSDE